MNESYEDERLTRALEQAPKIAVPDDFALRLMSRLPEKRAVRGFKPVSVSVGRRVCVAVMVVLAVLMLGLAPWSWGAAGNAHEGLKAVEWMLCAEFIGLTLWLSPAFGFKAQR